MRASSLFVLVLAAGCDPGQAKPSPIAPEPSAPASASVSASASVDAGPVAPFASASARPVPAGDAARYPVRWSAKLQLAKREDLDAAMRAKLTPNGEPLALPSDGGTVPVASCETYLDALDAGAGHADVGFAIAQESFFEKRCTPLWFVREATASATSYVSDLRLDRAPLEHLPVALAPYLGDAPDGYEVAVRNGAPLSTLGDFRVKHTAKDAVTFTDVGKTIESTVELLAFGDLDHDGVEDVLAMQSNHAIEGSFRGYTLYVLTQTKAGAVPVVVRTIQD